MTTVERRKSERLSLEVPVMVSMLDDKGKQMRYDLKSRDISSAGVFLMTDNPFELGTDVQMDIMLSFSKNDRGKGQKKTNIDISGNIVRTEADGMAVCFSRKYRISPYKL